MKFHNFLFSGHRIGWNTHCWGLCYDTASSYKCSYAFSLLEDLAEDTQSWLRLWEVCQVPWSDQLRYWFTLLHIGLHFFFCFLRWGYGCSTQLLRISCLVLKLTFKLVFWKMILKLKLDSSHQPWAESLLLLFLSKHSLTLLILSILLENKFNNFAKFLVSWMLLLIKLYSKGRLRSLPDFLNHFHVTVLHGLFHLD